MKKLLSTLGLDSLLPPYSLTSPFSTPHHSRPSSPNTSRRSSSRSRSRSRSRPSSRASITKTKPASPGNTNPTNPTIANPTIANPTNPPTNPPTSSTPLSNPDIADLKHDWEYPVSPFTQQQSSPRPLPFREHSSSSIITIKTPIPPGQGRARSKARGAQGVKKQRVPEIRIESGEGGENRGKEGGGVAKIDRGSMWRYGRHRGVVLPAERVGWENEEVWKEFVTAGVTGVKVSTKWGMFTGEDSAEEQEEEVKRLNEIIELAKSFSLGVLLEIVYPHPHPKPQSQQGEGSPLLTSIAAKIQKEVLGKYGNVIGLELSHGQGARVVGDEAKRLVEMSVKIWREVVGGEVVIYVPVYLRSEGEFGEWMEWGTKMRSGSGSGIILDVRVDEAVAGLCGELRSIGKGIDWVLTIGDGTVWEVLKSQGVEEWEGFVGCWFDRVV